MSVRLRQAAVPGGTSECAAVLDFTCVATWDGIVYIGRPTMRRACASLMKAASRTAHAGFVLDALEQVLHDRRPLHRAGSGITAIEAANTSRLNTPSAWPTMELFRKEGPGKVAHANQNTNPTRERSGNKSLNH